MVCQLLDRLLHQGGWICSAATAALPYVLAWGRLPTSLATLMRSEAS
jgi:hypothetical protein